MSYGRCLLKLKNLSFITCPTQRLTTSSVVNKEHRKDKRANIVKVDEGVPQEKTFEVEPLWMRKCEFPDENTNDRLFDGVRFADIPILHIRCTKNNTIYSLFTVEGEQIDYRSPRNDGFFNAKKKTNIAAQTTAIAFSSSIQNKGYSQVRICIRGLGPGRMASIKGLEMGGMNIVSITDRTRVCEKGRRARKQRRI